MNGLGEYLLRHVNKSIRVKLECDASFEFSFKGEQQAPVDVTQGDMLNEPSDAEKAQLARVGDTLEQQDRAAASKRPAKKAKKRGAKKAA